MMYQKYVLNSAYCGSMEIGSNLIHQPCQEVWLISKWLPVLTSLCDVRAGGPLKHPTIPGAQPATLRSGATFGWFWWKYYGQRPPPNRSSLQNEVSALRTSTSFEGVGEYKPRFQVLPSGFSSRATHPRQRVLWKLRVDWCKVENTSIGALNKTLLCGGFKRGRIAQQKMHFFIPSAPETGGWNLQNPSPKALASLDRHPKYDWIYDIWGFP